MRFLDELEPTEREAFEAVADRQSFLCGSRLMSEGEPAGYVMVILEGWTRITVRDGGQERVIAERGPGQLVGERGALRPNFRSATVTALSDVDALVMKARDFASFISAHERVLELVERQIWGRLVEDPPGPAEDVIPAGPPRTAGWAAPPSRELSPWVLSPRLGGENCTVLLTDVAKFGADYRNDTDREIIRREHLAIMRASLEPVWDACIHQDRGDGLLIIVPPQITTAKVMTCVNRELPDWLRQHNRTYGESVRFSLRIAASVGPVVADELGVSGESIIRASRLVEAEVLKETMAETGAALGIMVAPFVYETAIGRVGECLYAAEYDHVTVTNKEFAGPAWMRLMDLPPRPRHPSTAARGSAGGVC